MINDLEFNIAPLQVYDQPVLIHSFHSEGVVEIDMIPKMFRVSSICYPIIKKIKKKPCRPSLQKIDDVVRNVEIFSIIPSQNNLDNLENEVTTIE